MFAKNFKHRDMTPEFPWLDRNEYPFAAHYHTIDGHRLHYIDEGRGEVLVFVHGTPSWSFDFRHLIKELRSEYRCLAIDHIGFGLSDKPEHYDYSTQRHAQTLTDFLLEKDLSDITLVLHDFGGPIGFDFALRYPERIRRIVILNSWLWSSELDPEFTRMKKILNSPLLPFLYRNLNFSARFVLPKSFGAKKLSRSLRKQYTHPFADRTERNGTLAFAKSLLNDQNWFEQLWKQRSVLSEKPVCLIWGMNDPVILPHNLEKFVSGFPNAVVHKLETCGHFPQEEQPEETLQAMRQFLQRNPG